MQTARKLLASATIGILSVAALTSTAWGQDSGGTSKSLTVLNYVTGWTHDAVGYHPACFMLIENSSGRDLSNKVIRFQSRFTDLHTAEVTLGRTELRRELKPHQQFSLAIEGENGFELPFELYQWPSIEAKAMCRIGNSGDEGTETLMVAKIDSVARTTTEAFESLNQATSFNPSARPSRNVASSNRSSSSSSSTASAPPQRQVTPVTPLRLPESAAMRAAQTPMTSRKQDVDSTQSNKGGGDSNTLIALLNTKALPGLGDDFYNFEQRFGLPQAFDAKRPDWTWAKYRHSGSGTVIFAGAKERSGKVDIIILKVQRAPGIEQTALVNAGKNLAGKMKSQTLSSPAKSVRYLPGGRVELVSATSASYKVVCLSPEADDADNSFILVVTRVQQEVDTLLPSLATKTSLLDFLKFMTAQDGGGQ